MIRTLAILMLILAGTLGLGAAGGRGDAAAASCDDAACHEAVVRVACCGAEVEATPCHMDGGECTCGVAPTPDRQPQPQAPRPRTERDAPATAPAERPAWSGSLEWDEQTKRTPIATPSLLAALTNNEIQALMGVWRT